MREIKDVRIICVWHEIGEVRLCCTLRARLTFDTVYVQGAMTLSYIWLYLKKPVSPRSSLETGSLETGFASRRAFAGPRRWGYVVAN